MENAAEEDLRVDGCDGPSKKRVRRLCSAEGCTNYSVKGGVCVRHGAKVKRCSVEDCNNHVVSGGVCVRHGAKLEKKTCSFEGCNNWVVKGGVCVRHGGKVKRCSFEGCAKQAQNGGLCIKHGAKVKRCSAEGCNNIVVRGGVCVRHGAKPKACSVEGCTKQAKEGGVCINHGAKRKFKTCSVEGCTNQVQKGGVCRRHRAEAKPCGSKGRASNAPEDGAGGDRGAGGREDSEGEGPAPTEEYDSDAQRAATCLIIMRGLEGGLAAPASEYGSGWMPGAQIGKQAKRGGVCESHGRRPQNGEGAGPSPDGERDSDGDDETRPVLLPHGEWDSDDDDELGEAVYRAVRGDGWDAGMADRFRDSQGNPTCSLVTYGAIHEI